MRTDTVNGFEMIHSSGNVFADLGLADAEKLKIKTGLVIETMKAIEAHGLIQADAAKLMGITAMKAADMMRGQFTDLSERKLMSCLTQLGYDLEIKVRPAKEKFGHLVLMAA